MIGFRIRDIRFNDPRLITLLAPAINDLFWILTDPADAWNLSKINGISTDDSRYEEENVKWGEAYEAAIVKEAPGVFLLRPGFLSDNYDYIRQDWQQFGFVISPQNFENFSEFSPGFVEKNCRFYLSCTDGAYWDVFSTDKTVLRRIQESFPTAEQIDLESSFQRK